MPGFGDPEARILLVGLAPAAHGGNRTGRVFTGDASGDFLWPALHAAGLADRPASRRADDGLTLTDAYVAAAVRCAPPANKPTTEERDACAPFLVRELALLTELRVVVALGAFGWDAALRALRRARATTAGREPRFGHGAEAAVGPYTLVGSYHPSQQNTFTGRLTADMFDAVIARAAELAKRAERLVEGSVVGVDRRVLRLDERAAHPRREPRQAGHERARDEVDDVVVRRDPGDPQREPLSRAAGRCRARCRAPSCSRRR